MLTFFSADYTYTYTTTSTPDAASIGAILMPMLLLGLAFVALILASMWKIFTKAGKPGWAALVPIYNAVVLFEVVGRPTWWVLLLLLGFIPVVGSIITLVVGIIVSHDLSKSFGKDIGYTLLLLFLPFIGYPLLAFGDAKYQGPSVGSTTSTGGSVPPVQPTPPTPPAAMPPANPTPQV